MVIFCSVGFRPFASSTLVEGVASSIRWCPLHGATLVITDTARVLKGICRMRRRRSYVLSLCVTVSKPRAPGFVQRTLNKPVLTKRSLYTHLDNE